MKKELFLSKRKTSEKETGVEKYLFIGFIIVLLGVILVDTRYSGYLTMDDPMAGPGGYYHGQPPSAQMPSNDWAPYSYGSPQMPDMTPPTGMPPGGMPSGPQLPQVTSEMCDSISDPVAAQTCRNCVSNPASCVPTPTPIEPDGPEAAQKFCDEYKKKYGYDEDKIPKDICGNCRLDGDKDRGEECEPPRYTFGYYISGAQGVVEGQGQKRLCYPQGTMGYIASKINMQGERTTNETDIGCYWAWCGDGRINEKGSNVGEECDDGNLIDGDGCSSMCKKEKVCCKCLYVEPIYNCDEVLVDDCLHVRGCELDFVAGELRCVGGEFTCDSIDHETCLEATGCVLDDENEKCIMDPKIKEDCQRWVNLDEQKKCYQNPIPIDKIPTGLVMSSEQEIRDKLDFNQICTEKRILITGHSDSEECPAFFELANRCIEADPESVGFLQSVNIEHSGCSMFGNKIVRQMEAEGLKSRIKNKIIELGLSNKFSVSLTANQLHSTFTNDPSKISDCETRLTYKVSVESMEIILGCKEGDHCSIGDSGEKALCKDSLGNDVEVTCCYNKLDSGCNCRKACTNYYSGGTVATCSSLGYEQILNRLPPNTLIAEAGILPDCEGKNCYCIHSIFFDG